MRKLLGLTTAIVAVVVFSIATLAVAANVHLKGGPNAAPSFTDLGLKLNATGALAGLGQQNLTVTLTARADVTSTCTNGGGNASPGQNPAPITVSGSEAIPAGAIKNGNVAFDVTTNPPPSTIAGAPDCPNPNWTESIDDLLFTSATIVVRQPDTNGTGPVVFTVNCTFTPHTSNGPVPSGNVSCS